MEFKKEQNTPDMTFLSLSGAYEYEKKSVGKGVGEGCHIAYAPGESVIGSLGC